MVETNKQWGENARTAKDVNEAVSMIVDYLKKFLKNDPFGDDSTVNIFNSEIMTSVTVAFNRLSENKL